jgi:hypothetical protein
MKKLDSEELFNIFTIGDEEVYKEHGVEDMLDNSFVLFGMVVRGVENYYLIDQMYNKRYGEQYLSVRENIKLKYFNGLLNYLERINLSQADTLIALGDEFGLQLINYSLKELLGFYQEKEYYEKCAIIFKFIELFSLK